MGDQKFYNNLQSALANLNDNFDILEEQIDVELQMQYFEYVNQRRDKAVNKEIPENSDDLFAGDTPIEQKKEILAALSITDSPQAYRIIERFVTNTDGHMKQWGIMALHESRILLQSSLLDEQQIFISTGLGGKGKKLRYFVVFLNNPPDITLTTTQQKILKDELIFELEKHQGEFETIDFIDEFSTAIIMLPLKTDIRTVFRNVVAECNQYGNFLKPDVIITNVKIMSKDEIISLLNQEAPPEL